MTLTEIITNNEENMDNLDSFTNIPSSVRSEIEQLYNEINEKLENAIDNYGDDESDFSENDDED